MRPLVIALIASTLLGCGTAGSARSRPGVSPAAEDLLNSAAADFLAHGPRPLRFRNVRSGHLVTSAGVEQHRLCGEVLTVGDASGTRWVLFATIKTSPYEQWIGGQATSFCADRAMAWDRGDLSYLLQDRIAQSHRQ